MYHSSSAWTTFTLFPQDPEDISSSPLHKNLHKSSHDQALAGPWPQYLRSSLFFTSKERRRRREISSGGKQGKHYQYDDTSYSKAGHVHTHEGDHNYMPPFVDQLPPGPFFDIERSGNITALVGRPARLNCRVNQIGNRTVSTFQLTINISRIV